MVEGKKKTKMRKRAMEMEIKNEKGVCGGVRDLDERFRPSSDGSGGVHTDDSGSVFTLP